MAIRALARQLLPRGCTAARMVRTLRAPLRYGRDQQHLLPSARKRHVRRVEAPRPTRIRLRGEGESLPHAYEEAEGARGAAAPLLHTGAIPPADARSCAVSAAASLAAQSRSSPGISAAGA